MQKISDLRKTIDSKNTEVCVCVCVCVLVLSDQM